MYLFFDTETTGLPKNWKAPVSDLNNWPRMVQIAWRRYSQDGTLLSTGNHIIKPEGFIIPKDVARVHGITHEKALAEGEMLMDVLKIFSGHARESEVFVAHNISFDEKIIGAELIRSKLGDIFRGKEKICTMHETTDFCKIPGPYGYKWPKLPELHFKLFRQNFQEAHNAAVDIEITAKCFWELRRRNLI
jgi:DNA polymerase III subunit epsilon